MEQVSSYIQYIFTQYHELLLLISLTAIVSFVITPITGVISKRFQAQDRSTSLRVKPDRTRLRRMSTESMPNLGGVAIFIALIVGGIWAFQQGLFIGNEEKLMAIILGAVIIMVMGLIDSASEIPIRTQLLVQIIAVMIITLAGIKIGSIEILDSVINLNVINFSFDLAGYSLQISPIADIFTILWIVGLINAINWIAGIDALAGTISIFAAITLMLLGVKFGALFAAVIAAALAGSILGFLPFNFPPAKTYNGKAGDMLMGFLLAILSVISGAKLTTGIILLAIPIIDAVWVIFGRYLRHRSEFKNPLDILKISDNTHLHHRLLGIGLSVRQVLLVESTIFVAFCCAAYYLVDFREEAIYALGGLFLIMIFFSIVSVLQTRAKRRRKIKAEAEAVRMRSADVRIDDKTPEEKYAY